MINFEIEKKILNNAFCLVGGIDEAGRGPLAGPVVAACVTITKNFNYENPYIKQITDSKKLTKKNREKLFEIIHDEFQEIGIGICDCKTIDQINILQATFLAMKKAIGMLKQKPDYVLIDGNFIIPNYSLKQEAITKGDSKAISIAAASIIAKVTRDRLMLEAHEKYPQYNFDKHKGYGTKLHIEKLKKYGPCPIHRLTFRPVTSLSIVKK